MLVTSQGRRRKGSRERVSLPMGKCIKGICPAVLPLCCSLFVSLCLFVHISLRKHNSSQLTWSQGEHDHGNHTCDQSQRRISGKGTVALNNIWKHSIFSIPKTKVELNLFFVRNWAASVCSPDLCTLWKQWAWPSLFPDEASCPGNVTGYCESTVQMNQLCKCRNVCRKWQNP